MKPNFNLDDLPRKNVHSVPDGYFDKLPNRVMQRVTASPESGFLQNWFPAPLRLALAGTGFAAVFAMVFSLNVTNTAQPANFAAIEKTEIINYLVASGQVDQTDLVLLNKFDTDLTGEFINAPNSEIHRELEDQTIEDLYL